MKMRFQILNLSPKTLAVIDQANEIMADPEFVEYTLTLRQLYYQFVARTLIPNTQREYNRLGDIINKGRLAGLIDWNNIQDLTRRLEKNSHWVNPSDIIDSAESGYAIDKWKGQEYQPEVWVEKEALASVISNVCDELDVPWFCCRGYVSQSAMHKAGMRMRTSLRTTPVIIHLGDHDPSGMDMSRDIKDRLYMFTSRDIKVSRIALNMEQVKEYNLPPNPAKVTDSRSDAYIAKYGNESWELDALLPSVLVKMVEDAVEEYRDDELYNERCEQEAQDKRELQLLTCNYEDAMNFLNEQELTP